MERKEREWHRSLWKERRWSCSLWKDQFLSHAHEYYGAERVVVAGAIVEPVSQDAC